MTSPPAWLTAWAAALRDADQHLAASVLDVLAGAADSDGFAEVTYREIATACATTDPGALGAPLRLLCDLGAIERYRRPRAPNRYRLAWERQPARASARIRPNASDIASVAFTLPRSTLNAIEAHAARAGQHVASVADIAMREYLANHPLEVAQT